MSRLAVYCVLVVFVGLALADEKYTGKYDNVDLDSILTNDRLLSKYDECLLAADDSKCTEDGKLLKGLLSEALAEDCGKCTDKQKSGLVKATKYLTKNKPDLWTKLEQKFDPTGSLLKKHPDYKS